MSLKVYGHFVSQPVRSVLWLLKASKVEHEFIKVEPLSGQTRTPEYLAKFPSGKAPVIEDGSNNDFKLSESSSIMQYVCETRKLDNWYPSSSFKDRARIHEYMSNHHVTSRRVSKEAFFPFMRAFMKGNIKNWSPSTESRELIQEMGEHFALNFLNSSYTGCDGVFIGGRDTPSIADLLAYGEFGQAPLLFDINYNNNKVREWLDACRNIDEHDNVHKSVLKLKEIALKQGMKL